MDAFTPYLAEIHRQELLDQAQAHRLAKSLRDNRIGVPAWRRSLGSLFASAAATLDPEHRHHHCSAHAGPVLAAAGARAMAC